MDEPLPLSIRDINPHIVCSLCAGYFIDATTITECLHTFCKSCIVKYLRKSKQCPQCNIKIHETQPLFNLRADRTLQDVVFKLVPGLFENEEIRKEEFYKSRGSLNTRVETLSVCLGTLQNHPEGHRYEHDEQVCICLDRLRQQSVFYNGSNFVLKVLQRKFVRCSVRVLVTHIKHMLNRKLNVPTGLELDVLCGNEVLPGGMSMKQICLMVWDRKQSPMVLFYTLKSADLGFKDEQEGS